jgi:putative DNA primase/helicase
MGEGDYAWPEPRVTPLFHSQAEEWSPILLPNELADFVTDEAERMGVQPDGIAAHLLPVLSAACAGRIAMRPKERDSWAVVPNIWMGVVKKSGEKKTAEQSAVNRLLAPLEADEAEKYKAALQTYTAEFSVYEAETARLKANWKRGKATASEDERRKMYHESRQHESRAPTPPRWRRFKSNDTTIEAVGMICAGNERESDGHCDALMVQRDEGVAFLASLHKKGAEGAVGFYNEAREGKSYTLDRVGRGHLYVPNLTVSIDLNIQPGPLDDYMREVFKGGTEDSGFLQRFVLIQPPPRLPFERRDREPNASALRAAERVVSQLAYMLPETVGAAAEHPRCLPFLRFDPEAQEAYWRWREDWLEPLLRDDSIRDALKSFASKLEGLVPAYALLYHLSAGDYGSVSPRAMNAARAWSVYVWSHTLRIYSRVLGPLTPAALLQGRIVAGSVEDGITVRDLRKRDWSGLKTEAAINEALQELESAHWLRVECQQHPKGGQPSRLVHLNPRLARGLP